MFSNKKLAILAVLVMIAPLVLAACGPTPEPSTIVQTVVVEQTKVVPGEEKTVVQTVEVEKTIVATQIVEVTPTPVPVTRKGGWADMIVFTSIDSAEAAVKQIQAGQLDVYAYGVADAAVFETVKSDPKLSYINSYGSYTELTFNPVLNFTDGRLNPFGDPKIREAMNWLVDRSHIVQEIYSGLGKTKLFCLNSAFADYARYVDTARELEAYYAYNPEKAKEVITAQMESHGATLGADGKWQYNGQPVTIVMVIRTEDERRQIGDYVANQLETVGFTVDRQYKTRSEASPIWVQSNPADGLWNIYTGGWITTAISRDDGSNFAFFYMPYDYPIPLHQAYTPAPEYDEVGLKLRNNEFTTLEERAELFKKAMRLSLQDSVRAWLVDQLSFSPMNANIEVAYDLAGGISGSRLYPYTIRWKGQEGGTIRIAQPGILVDPWNPVAGSNWIYDMMPIRATGDVGVIPDPYTGLVWPQRIESAQVYVKEGLPVAKTLDWLTLEFVPSIEVPGDAWVDWDATNQKFITAAEKFTQTQTANTKVVVTYPKDLFQTVKWHDGSPLSVGDFVMYMIMQFDRGKPESALYDEAAASTLEAFLAHFKGVKILSTDPLTIETYDDTFYLDAELMVATWWPSYDYGQAPWHTIALGALADGAGELAFSADKADANQIEWMSYIAGPSLEVLKKHLDAKVASPSLYFTPTLEAYVTADEAAARWANLKSWYSLQGHFWVGTGPYYLNKAFPVEQTLSLLRNPDFADTADKWNRFGTPMLATAEIDGPGQVKIGEEAAFDVYITFQDEPYPTDNLKEVKYLLFDAKGALVATGMATAVEEGKWQVVIPADVTGKLEAGSNKLEVAIVSNVVSIPTFAVFEFVTAP